MHRAEDIIKRVEAQFKMDCALDPSGEAGKRGYLIGRRPKMPDQTFMTDTAYGWLMRERMEKAAAGIDYGIDSRARVYEGMDLFFRAILFCGKGYLMADEAIYDWCCRESGDRDRSRNGSAVFQTCAGWMTAFAANAGRLRIPIFIFSLECRKRR